MSHDESMPESAGPVPAGEGPQTPAPRASKVRGFLWIGGLCVLTFGLLFLIVPSVNALSRARLGDQVSDIPEELTLAELIQRGAKGNPHILLKEYEFDEYVGIIEKDKSLGQLYEYIVVPIHPLPAGRQGGAPIKVVVKAPVKTKGALDDLLARKTMQGLIINAFENLNVPDKNLLKQKHPGEDFDNVLLFQPDRSPARTASSPSFYIAGAACVVVGIVMWWFGRWRDVRGMVTEEIQRIGEKSAAQKRRE